MTSLQKAPERLFQLRSHKHTHNIILDIPSAVHIAISSDATDLRDKVYCLLVMLPAQTSTMMQPNYSSNFSKLNAYTMFTAACVLLDNRSIEWVNAHAPRYIT
jgi:hypothetical protein